MPGTWVKQTWQFNPVLDASPKYRRACHYEAFVPETLASLAVTLSAVEAGVVSDAERATRQLNETASPALAPLARLLLRTESIASSKVEGLQLGAREMARAEAQAESGLIRSQTALELIDNINAMELAIGDAAAVQSFGVDEIVAIHARLMQHAPNTRLAGRIRTQHLTGSAATTTIRAAPTSYRRRRMKSDGCSRISARRSTTISCHHWCRRRSCTRSSRRFTRSRTGTGGPGARSSTWCCDDAV